MERHHLSDPGSLSANGSGDQLPSFAIMPAKAEGSVKSALHRQDSPAFANSVSPRRGDAASERLSRLSLHEFCERIALLAELELPCSVLIANPSAEQISRGVVRRIERDADRLNLFGDGFSLHLHRDNIDAIWLVSGPGGDDQGMAIEIHNRTGSLVARLFGMQDGIGAAVWQDVMGNPSFAVA